MISEVKDYNWKGQAIRFLTAQTVSLFGSALVQFAIIWYITLKTSSGFMLGFATLCGYAPQLAISLFAGVWLDRYDKKFLMIIADAAIAAATLIAVIIFFTGFKSTAVLFTVLIIRSIGTGIQTPAFNAFIPEIAPQDKLIKINGVNSMLVSITFFIAPAVSAILMSYMPIEKVLFVDIITAIIGISIMFTVKSMGAPIRADKQTALKDIKDGLVYMRKNRFVRQQIVFMAIVNVLVSPVAFLTPLIISRNFGADLMFLSVSEMVFSGGAIIGGLLIAWWGGFANKRITITVATMAYGVLMCGMGISYIFIFYLLCNLLLGIALPFFNAPFTSALQERAAPSMHGRVFAMVQIAVAGSLPLGSIIFGPLSDIFTVNAVIFCTGMLLCVFAVLAFYRKSFINA